MGRRDGPSQRRFASRGLLQRNPGDPNTGEGKISAAAALSAASKTSSRPGSAAAGSVSSPKPNPALSKSMTPLSKLGPAKADGQQQ